MTTLDKAIQRFGFEDPRTILIATLLELGQVALLTATLLELEQTELAEFLWDTLTNK